MAKSYKPTRKDFEKFKAEFMRCADLLNLGDWLINILFEPLNDRFAEIEDQPADFLATVVFNSKVISKDNVAGYDPKRTARHEATHLFHARLEYIGRCRYVRPDDFAEESERLCRVMEKLLEP